MTRQSGFECWTLDEVIDELQRFRKGGIPGSAIVVSWDGSSLIGVHPSSDSKMLYLTFLEED